MVFLFDFLCFLSFDSLYVEDTQQSRTFSSWDDRDDKGMRLELTVVEFMDG